VHRGGQAFSSFLSEQLTNADRAVVLLPSFLRLLSIAFGVPELVPTPLSPANSPLTFGSPSEWTLLFVHPPAGPSTLLLPLLSPLTHAAYTGPEKNVTIFTRTLPAKEKKAKEPDGRPLSGSDLFFRTLASGALMQESSAILDAGDSPTLETKKEAATNADNDNTGAASPKATTTSALRFELGRTRSSTIIFFERLASGALDVVKQHIRYGSVEKAPQEPCTIVNDQGEGAEFDAGNQQESESKILSDEVKAEKRDEEENRETEVKESAEQKEELVSERTEQKGGDVKEEKAVADEKKVVEKEEAEAEEKTKRDDKNTEAETHKIAEQQEEEKEEKGKEKEEGREEKPKAIMRTCLFRSDQGSFCVLRSYIAGEHDGDSRQPAVKEKQEGLETVCWSTTLCFSGSHHLVQYAGR